MSAPKTLRVVPLTNLMTLDSQDRQEGVACDLPTDEADNLIRLGLAVAVKKGEVPEGTAVEMEGLDTDAPVVTGITPGVTLDVPLRGEKPAKS